jgi:hypothetical protein
MQTDLTQCFLVFILSHPNGDTKFCLHIAHLSFSPDKSMSSTFSNGSLGQIAKANFWQDWTVSVSKSWTRWKCFPETSECAMFFSQHRDGNYYTGERTVH